MTTYQFNQVLPGQGYPGTVNPDHRWVMKVRYFTSGGKFGIIASAPHRMALAQVLADMQDAVQIVLDNDTEQLIFEYKLVDKDAYTRKGYDWQPIETFDEFVYQNTPTDMPG